MRVEINRSLEMSKRSMGKPSRENLKFDELIRDAIAFLIKRGEIKIPPKDMGCRPAVFKMKWEHSGAFRFGARSWLQAPPR